MKKEIWIAVFGLIAVSAMAAHDHDGEEAEHAYGEAAGHAEHEEGVVKLPESVVREFGIKIAEAGSGTIELTTKLPGEIVINQDRLAHVTPRYRGIVLEVRKNIGDKVRRGDVMAVLEGNDSLSAYPLKAMIDGVVIGKHIALGETPDAGQVVYIIADLSNVWADITLYQKDLPEVKPGQPVKVSGGVHLPDATGTISYVSPTLDEHTRTGLARAVLDNRAGTWKPGMFITAEIVTGKVKAEVAVPRSAIFMLEHGPSVFVKTEHGFEPREVKPGRAGRHTVEILEGLRPGEAYVAEGGFTLKAELGRGEMSSGHSH